jgi:hypothetical protein
MARSPALTALLAKYGIVPCGAPACVFGPAGQFTSGMCSCLHPTTDGWLITVRRLAAIIRELDQQPEQIAAWLEQCGDYAETGRFAASLAEDVRAGQWKEQG